ncbi:hypothetical protein [Alicyclobacillus sendaiensis]|uniref:hypothetical protein n=1 Tax=Alicyclobacillus sendaiensis TaxID=192387 RepID=UPI0026F44D40|nr:hypothetical protein [Alicyclobacillus sendaiensis]
MSRLLVILLLVVIVILLVLLFARRSQSGPVYRRGPFQSYQSGPYNQGPFQSGYGPNYGPTYDVTPPYAGYRPGFGGAGSFLGGMAAGALLSWLFEQGRIDAMQYEMFRQMEDQQMIDALLQQNIIQQDEIEQLQQQMMMDHGGVYDPNGNPVDPGTMQDWNAAQPWDNQVDFRDDGFQNEPFDNGPFDDSNNNGGGWV